MKTVMLFGTFDILHAGHLSLFRQARQLGDRLVVVVARDRTTQRIKKSAPWHNEKERKTFLQHIDLVDDVVLGDLVDVYKIIQIKKPDIIALGYDQRTFVSRLQSKIKEFKLSTRIVRLKPFAPKRHKTQRLKMHLMRQI